MTVCDPLQSFIDLCLDPPGPPSLVAAFRRAIEALGFRYFACCSHVDPFSRADPNSRANRGIPPRLALYIHNYPTGWVNHFQRARLHRIDPILQLAQREPIPFFWDQALRIHPLTVTQRKILAQASAYGLAHGYTVPIHLSWTPGNLPASCSVIPDTPNPDPHRYLVVQTLADHLYAALQRLLSPRRPARRRLPPRERQCLILAAQGKDDWTIAKLLRVSPETVHSHIQHAMCRLEVTTRVQAIILALQTRQVLYDEVTAPPIQAKVVPTPPPKIHLIR